MGPRQVSLWPSRAQSLANRLDNLRFAIGLFAELVKTTSVNPQRMLADPFLADGARAWLVFAARWTAWTCRNLREDVECPELETLDAQRRGLVASATAVLRVLGVDGTELEVAELPC